jgi:hypothetical protein
VAAYVPPGWPAGVHPPGSEEFEQTAVTWMLDVVPPDYRLHGVLRRHPLALAVLARHHLAACIQGARDGYRTARTELASLPPGGVDAVLEVYRAEGRRLVETARAVELVGRALRGEVFTPQLGQGGEWGRGAPPHAGARTAAPSRQAAPRETPPRATPPRDAAPGEPGPRRSAGQTAPSETAKRAPAAREATPRTAARQAASHSAPSETAKRPPAARQAAPSKTAKRAPAALEVKRAPAAREAAPGTAPRKGTARSGGAAEKPHGAGPSAPKPGRRPAPR